MISDGNNWGYMKCALSDVFRLSESRRGTVLRAHWLSCSNFASKSRTCKSRVSGPANYCASESLVLHRVSSRAYTHTAPTRGPLQFGRTTTTHTQPFDDTGYSRSPIMVLLTACPTSSACSIPLPQPCWCKRSQGGSASHI